MKKFFNRYGIWILILFFVIVYSLIGVLRYNHFLAGGYDLPHYTQAIWQYSQFQLAKVTIFGNINILGDHFEPILILLALIYRLFPDPRTVIIIQALISVLTAYPLFLIAKYYLKKSWLSILPVLIFLLHPSFQYALDYDFHTSTIIILPLSLLYFSFITNKKYLYWISLIFVFLCKEDGAIFALFLGLFSLFLSKKRKIGIYTIILSSLYFYFAQFKLIPFFYGGDKNSTVFIDFYFLGKNLPEILRNALTKPWLLLFGLIDNQEKIKTLIILLGPFSMLPVISIFFLFNSLPFLAEKFYSQTTSRWLYTQYHQINILSLLTVGFIYSLKNLNKINRKLALILSLTSLIITIGMTRFLHLPITRIFHLSYLQKSDQEKKLDKIIESIPTNTSVSAQFPFTSHLANREKIYLFPENENKVEYVLLTLNGLPTYPLNDNQIENYIKRYLANKRYKLIISQEKTYLFNRI